MKRITALLALLLVALPDANAQALTDHQKLHLNAVVAEMIDDDLQNDDYKQKLADAKKIKKSKLSKYLKDQQKIAEDILKADKMPVDFVFDHPSDAHDFIEKKVKDLLPPEDHL